MIALTNKFNTTFPRYSASFFTGSTFIVEPRNATNGKFYKLELTGIDGFSFPHGLGSALSSFATNANHTGSLNKDCDGIILFEYGGQKYMLFAELKSTFSTDDLGKAQEQIVGTSIKFISTLSVLEGVNIDEYKIIGVIVSYEATSEQITGISKNNDGKARFAIRLNFDKKVILSGAPYHQLYSPLSVKDMTIYHVPVIENSTYHTVDIGALL